MKIWVFTRFRADCLPDWDCEPAAILILNLLASSLAEGGVFPPGLTIWDIEPLWLELPLAENGNQTGLSSRDTRPMSTWHSPRKSGPLTSSTISQESNKSSGLTLVKRTHWFHRVLASFSPLSTQTQTNTHPRKYNTKKRTKRHEIFVLWILLFYKTISKNFFQYWLVITSFYPLKTHIKEILTVQIIIKKTRAQSVGTYSSLAHILA